MKSKKAIKDRFKEIKLKIGVFQIKNTLNDKILIESSTDLVSIWNKYTFQLNGGLHQNSSLQKEWIEFGQENFTYDILSEIKQDESKTIDYRKEAKLLAKLFIDEMQPFDDRGYNIK